MPGDINTRMRIVDSCLRKKEGCTYREILTECKKQTGIDVPETTLRDTIRKLKKKLNVDIVLINNEEDNRSKRFRYKVTSYRDVVPKGSIHQFPHSANFGSPAI